MGHQKTHLRWTPQKRARNALGACQDRTGSAHGGGGPHLGFCKTYLRWTPQKRARSPLGACQERTGSAQEQGVLIWCP